MNKYKLAVMVIGIASISLSGCASGASSFPTEISIKEVSEHTWEVSGSYETKVAPDIAEITFQIYTEDIDATKCQQENTELINKVTNALKEYGIDGKYIQTSDFYLDRKRNPYDYYDYLRSDIQPKEDIKDLGYEMTSILKVANVPVDKSGDVMTLGVENGANEIRGLQFKTTKYDEEYLEAVKKALADSREKADALVEAAGCRIAGIQTVKNNSSYSPFRAVSLEDYAIRDDGGEKATGAREFSGESVDVSGGELDITAKVSVTYLIEEK